MKKFSILLICVMLFSMFPASAADGAFTNGDFSLIASDGFMPEGWKIGYGSGAVAGENIRVLENQYEGKNALQLYDPNSTGDPHYKHMTVAQSVVVIPGAEYTISGYSKLVTKGTSQGGVIKVTAGDEEYVLTAWYSAPDVWEKQSLRFTIPDAVTTVSVLVRLVGGGEILWADMKMECTKKYVSVFEADAIFYYEEQTAGTASLQINPYFSADCAGGSVSFSVEDGGSVLWNEAVSLTDGKAAATFPLRHLSVLKKAYTLRGILKNAAGTELENLTFSIYRYPRPSMVSADGTVTVGGEEIRPVFAYHVRKGQYEACAAAGINIIQNAKHDTVQGYLDMLDGALDENGKPVVYMLLPLYNSMKPAGHPANLELTKAVAASEEIRNHPALFGYIVIDEPFLNMENPEEHMERAYTAIREHDDVHPVFIMENYETKYGTTVKYADILGADIYAASARQDGLPLSDGVYQYAKMGKEAADVQNKPLWVLLQTFDYKDYFPTAEELRGQMYQAMLAGADTVGFYCIDNAKDKEDLHMLPIWTDICRMLADGEFDLLRENRRKMCLEGEDYIARVIADGGNLAVQVENRTMAEKTLVFTVDEGGGNFAVSKHWGEMIAAGVLQGQMYVTLPASGGATVFLKPEGVVAYTGDKTLVGAVRPGEAVSVLVFGKHTETTANARVYAALYAENGELLSFSAKASALTADTAFTITVSDISVPRSAGQLYMKVFLWDGGNTPILVKTVPVIAGNA